MCRADASYADGEIVGELYYYASRFFNAGYALAALVPVQEGLLLFYIHRFWVDYWSGMPKVKQSLGQKLMSSEMLERARQSASLCG